MLVFGARLTPYPNLTCAYFLLEDLQCPKIYMRPQKQSDRKREKEIGALRNKDTKQGNCNKSFWQPLVA